MPSRCDFNMESGLSLNLNIQLLSSACCLGFHNENAVDAWLVYKKVEFSLKAFVGAWPKINSTLHASFAVCEGVGVWWEMTKDKSFCGLSRIKRRKTLLAIFQRFLSKNCGWGKNKIIMNLEKIFWILNVGLGKNFGLKFSFKLIKEIFKWSKSQNRLRTKNKPKLKML